VSQEEFHQLFAKFGDVTSALIQVDDKGNSKGFGFINYENPKDAQTAVEKLHDSEYYGRRLSVFRSPKKVQREDSRNSQPVINTRPKNIFKSRSHEQAETGAFGKSQGVNLYVKNLEDDFDDEKLYDEFKPFGTIVGCKVTRDKKKTSKSFGFVCFSSLDEATKAVAEMNNKMIGSKPLHVSLAQRRVDCTHQLESQTVRHDQNHQIKLQAVDPPASPRSRSASPSELQIQLANSGPLQWSASSRTTTRSLLPAAPPGGDLYVVEASSELRILSHNEPDPSQT